MLYPFQSLFDVIFPPTAHELRLRPVTKERFTQWYQPKEIGTIVCLSEYRLPEVQAAIAACKFEHNYHAATLLGSLVAHYLKSLPPKKTLLIPVPLSAKRAHKRGFNQVERVLRSMGTIPYVCIITANLLIRPADTIPQTALPRKKRLTNVNKAFSVLQKNKFYLDGTERIIICDDVTTTGATMNAAMATLVPHVPKNIEIIRLAWAH